ncbi:MAG: DsbA family protein [Thermomicrobiales bacterium]|nr:DsbA family protein [Thermomicrobiales bacterium]
MSFSNESKLTLPVGDRDHGQGTPGSPITLVEYGDYECPHCIAAHSVVREIQRALGNDLFFVFRNFPLTTSHPHAQIAAEAAEAAGAQGRFWQMHDAILERNSSLSEDLLLELGNGVGLDPSALAQSLADGTFKERVREDFMSGVRSGVNGTPTFFVNERRYDGFADFDSLMDAIDAIKG